jgi:hypothetical protein
MVELLGTARTASAILGFDTASTVSLAQAQALRACGFGFCARYLKRTPSEQPPSTGPALTVAEAEDLLACGLAIIPVQYGSSTLVPSAAAGTAVGEAAAINAFALGIPTGVTIWCDLEWSQDVSPDPNATIAYANAWHDAVVDAGLRAGLYIGANVPLDGEALGELAFTSYWKSASRVAWPTPRGFQLVQGLTVELDGLSIDPDVSACDADGDRLVWLAARERDA